MKNNIEKTKEEQNKFFNLFSIIISSLLFMLANPNFLFNKGFGFCAWFYYIPVVLIIRKNNLKTSAVTGFFYGAISYALYAYWLVTYGVVFYIIAVLYYGILYAALFFVLKIIQDLFKHTAWFVQLLAVLVFEYLKTLGFAGFSYGTTGYTQYLFPQVLQIAKYTGVWGVSAIVLMPSFFIPELIQRIKTPEAKKQKCGMIISAVIYAVIMISSFITYYKNENIKENINHNIKTIKIAAVQNNDEPWANGVEKYRENIQEMLYLTEEALDLNEDIKLVVWPETAVVPSIKYYEDNSDERRHRLITSLMQYFNEKNTAFVIGNAYTENDAEYNSALFFIPGKNVLPPNPQIYSKIHLVPFSEYFPYKKQLPIIYKMLEKADVHFWEPGKQINIFDLDGFKFGTPICFEDTFSEIPVQMCRNGAQCLINLSNDSWSQSVACQNQHLAMAVLRSVENEVPSVRSTTSGQTCYINKKGKILKQAEPFCRTYIICNVNVADDIDKENAEETENAGKTFYTKHYDVFIYIVICLFCILLIKQIILAIIKRQWVRNVRK